MNSSHRISKLLTATLIATGAVGISALAILGLGGVGTVSATSTGQSQSSIKALAAGMPGYNAKTGQWATPLSHPGVFALDTGGHAVALDEKAISGGSTVDALVPGKTQSLVFSADNPTGYNKPLPAIAIQSWTSDAAGCSSVMQPNLLTLNAAPTPTIPTGYATPGQSLTGFATVTLAKSVPSLCVGAQLYITYYDGPDVWLSSGLAQVPGALATADITYDETHSIYVP
jgi:hypothetical protein